MEKVKTIKLHNTNPNGSIQVIRAGVIPYCHYNNKIYWLLGNKRLSDFGGGCKISKRETAYQCILRETQEEAGNKMSTIIKNSIDQNLGIKTFCMKSRKNPIIQFYMVLVPIKFTDIGYFQKSREIRFVHWYQYENVMELKNKRFKEPIRRFVKLYKEKYF